MCACVHACMRTSVRACACGGMEMEGLEVVLKTINKYSFAN